MRTFLKGQTKRFSSIWTSRSSAYIVAMHTGNWSRLSCQAYLTWRTDNLASYSWMISHQPHQSASEWLCSASANLAASAEPLYDHSSLVCNAKNKMAVCLSATLPQKASTYNMTMRYL